MGDHGGRRYGNPYRFTDRGNEEPQRDPQDIEEIARLQQRVRDLEMQHEEHSEEGTNTDPRIWDDGDYADNPFAQDPNVFLDWLQIMERVFDLQDISDEYKGIRAPYSRLP
uniref:Uncharacterized protein n=1 Tax=Lactuca sativa TaxID=4236 RepID=A0A9R1V7K3_LACSA|nr:hypothetical protein LSAT_V11C600337710 [Lactuca sativa]